MNALQIAYEGCPLCGSESTLLGAANCTKHGLWHSALPDTLEWMRCSACNHVHTRHYWSEAGLAEVFRNAHANQLAGGTASPDAKRATWVPVVEKVIRALGGYQVCFAGSSPVWVDVGCGDGTLTMTAADYGFAAVGLDARQETVSRIRQLGFRAEQGDFMKMKFEGQLDVLSMMDVLEHIPYPRDALRKAAQLLRPGGVIVISLPDLTCSSWKVMDAAKANPYWIEIEHHHNFSRQRLVALLKECGFDIADFSVPHRYKAQMEIYAVRV
ncbi:class I SAM-dependent methyltransferase [Extensimonas perlucida]|uniref:class I SAM-dependent methyltransferase n=1 Tax=Extensimonas perlucida TaxID=2590786 RepID=UPI00119EC7DB|nr:class I SAM-dependent methyltransferase [Extensimonas perlucida]